MASSLARTRSKQLSYTRMVLTYRTIVSKDLPEINVMGSPRVNPKQIFSDLVTLCERLEQLDIEAIVEADDVSV
jgi:hypothetical protein